MEQIGIFKIFGIPVIGDWLSLLVTIPVLLYKLIRRLIQNYQKRTEKQFWGGEEQSLQTIVPAYNNKYARIEDVLAFDKIRTKTDMLSLSISRNFSAPDRQTNSLCICGPKAHIYAQQLQESHSLRYSIEDDGENLYILDNKTGNSIYSPSDKNGKNIDIAIVGQIFDERANSRSIFAWGLHGVGTLGAIQFLVSPKFNKKIMKKHLNKNFIFLVQVNYQSTEQVNTVNVYSSIESGSNIFHKG